MKHTLFMALILLAGCSSRTPSGPAEPLHDQITSGHTSVATTYYPAATTNTPAIILVPQPGADHRAWDLLARQAQRQGYAALVLNLAPLPRNATAQTWLAQHDLIRAAKADLLHRNADPKNLAIAGAGVTANLALLYANQDPDMQATILLSPGVEYDGLSIQHTIREFGKRPIFIAVTEGDAYAHSSSLQLHDRTEGYCEMRVYDGAAHGTDIFSAHPDLAEQILRWLKPILVPQNES